MISKGRMTTAEMDGGCQSPLKEKKIPFYIYIFLP